MINQAIAPLRTYEISISDADGAGYHHLETDNREYALKFLEHLDHEGSSISLRIMVYGGEVYKLLAPEGEEFCLGCGKPTYERDCGCPAGTGWRKKKAPRVGEK